MGSLLLPLPCLAIVLAALDCVLARWSHPWRAGDVRLFFHAYYLWAAFGLLALGPAALALRLWERLGTSRARGAGAARPWIALLACMVLPVIAHATLDRHTSLIGWEGLLEARPWVELASVLLGALGVLLGSGWLLAPLPGARTAAILVVLALAAGVLVPPERSPVTRESARGRPNLLLLVWDTCRSDRLEPYGQERNTSPGLERLASEAVVFEDSLSVSSFTFSSHLSLLTGVLPSTHGARLSDMRFDPARASSIAALLAEQGYRTGAFVGTDVLGGRTGIGEGFEVWDDAVDPAVCDTHAWRLVHDLQSVAAQLVPGLRFDGRPHWIQDFQRPAGEVLDRARSWIRRPDPRPWFVLVNLYDAHWPFLPEGEGRELVRPYQGPVDGFLFRSHDWVDGYRMSAADKQHVSDLYEAEIFDLDRAVSGFLDSLRLERGDTAVLMTSDHGEGMGEEDTWNHDGIREPQVRVPLILRPPGAHPPGRRVGSPVSGLDVAPTLLALAGLEPPASMQGENLLAETLPVNRERWVEDRDHLDPDDVRIALYRGAFKLVRLGAGPLVRHELHDLTVDPVGTRDVQAEHPALFAELVRRCEQERDSLYLREAVASDRGSADALRGLGYAGE